MTTAPAFELSIAKQQTTDYIDGRTQGYRIKMVVTAVRGFLDAAVFMFRRTETNINNFEAICRPSDLVDFAIDVPDEHGALRLDTIDLIFASKAEALETADLIQEELKVLCDEMAKINSDLSAIETVPVVSDLTVEI